IEFQYGAIALRFHVYHFTFALRYRFDSLTSIGLRKVDRKFLDRLTLHTVDLFIQYLWLTDLKFVAFATHCFDQYRQVKNTTSIHHERIGRACINYTKGEVLFEFFIKTIFDVA